MAGNIRAINSCLLGSMQSYPGSMYCTAVIMIEARSLSHGSPGTSNGKPLDKTETKKGKYVLRLNRTCI